MKNLLESSLFARTFLSVCRWLSRVALDSLTGRGLMTVFSVIQRCVAGSSSFSTRRLVPLGLADPGQPVTVRAMYWPFARMQRVLAYGAAGRGLRAGAVAATWSRFSGGAWIRLVGGLLLGLGCGFSVFAAQGHEAASILATHGGWILAAVLMFLGAVLVVFGPSLEPVFGASVFGRILRSVRVSKSSRSMDTREGVGLSPVLVAGAILCITAGVFAGTRGASAVAMLLLSSVGLCLIALLLWRPEVILIAVAAFPWLDWAARGALGGLAPLWDDALLLLAVMLLLWATLVLGRGFMRSVPIGLPLLCVLVAAVGSIVVRRVPSNAAIYGLRVMFEPMIFYLVGYLFPKTKRWTRAAVGVFLVGAVALALHGIYQYAVGAPMPAQWIDVNEIGLATRAFSVVKNPNVLGAILAMATLISLSISLAPGTRVRWRVITAVMAIVQFVGLAVTFSRGVWLGFGVGLTALLVMAYRRYVAPALALAVVGWFAAPRVLINRLLFALGTTYLAKSQANGRIYRWETSLLHISQHPWLGVGFGTFGGTSAYMTGYWGIWTDNYYLQLGAEGGLVLLLAYLWMLFRSLKGLARGYRVATDPTMRALAAGVFAAFLAVAVSNFFAANIETLTAGVVFWFLAGLATSAAFQDEGQTGSENLPSLGR